MNGLFGFIVSVWIPPARYFRVTAAIVADVPWFHFFGLRIDNNDEAVNMEPVYKKQNEMKFIIYSRTSLGNCIPHT